MKIIGATKVAVMPDNTFIFLNHRDEYEVYSIRVVAGKRQFNPEKTFAKFSDAMTFSDKLNYELSALQMERFLNYEQA